MRLKQRLTFLEAREMLKDAGVVKDVFWVGSNEKRTTLSLPAGEIDADKNGFFKLSDVCRLIGYAQSLRREQLGQWP